MTLCCCPVGLIGGLFTPAFNVATNDSFHLLPPGVRPLGVYTALFWFAATYVLLGLLVSSLMMRWPPQFLGQSRTSWAAWAKVRPAACAVPEHVWEGTLPDMTMSLCTACRRTTSGCPSQASWRAPLSAVPTCCNLLLDKLPGVCKHAQLSKHS